MTMSAQPRLQVAKPLEIVHDKRWMDALMAKTPSAPAAPATLPPISAIGEWRTSIAMRPEQFRAAEELVQRRYAWRGYRAPISEACVKQEEMCKVMLLAENAGRLMGTLTVRPDSRRGLYAEAAYELEIERLRRNGHRLGELVKLAIEEGAPWKDALDALVQTTYLITRVIYGLTDVIIEVNPRHASFYSRIFGFVSEAAERFCERAGAPSVLLRLDLALFGHRLQLAA